MRSLHRSRTSFSGFLHFSSSLPTVETVEKRKNKLNKCMEHLVSTYEENERLARSCGSIGFERNLKNMQQARNILSTQYAQAMHQMPYALKRYQDKKKKLMQVAGKVLAADKLKALNTELETLEQQYKEIDEAWQQRKRIIKLAFDFKLSTLRYYLKDRVRYNELNRLFFKLYDAEQITSDELKIITDIVGIGDDLKAYAVMLLNKDIYLKINAKKVLSVEEYKRALESQSQDLILSAYNLLPDSKRSLELALFTGDLATVKGYLSASGKKLTGSDFSMAVGIVIRLYHSPFKGYKFEPFLEGLIKEGVDINSCHTQFKLTPTQLAARYMSPELLSFLVNKGCRLEQQDNEGRSISDLALLAPNCIDRHNTLEIIKSLRARAEELPEKSAETIGIQPLKLAYDTGSATKVPSFPSAQLNVLSPVVTLSSEKSKVSLHRP